MIRAHVFYSGIVQGVGFRYTVSRCATPLGLTGWVRNMPDGRVELLAEGPREKVEDFLEQVEEHFRGSINNKEITIEETQGQFKDFRITR